MLDPGDALRNYPLFNLDSIHEYFQAGGEDLEDFIMLSNSFGMSHIRIIALQA